MRKLLLLIPCLGLLVLAGSALAADFIATPLTGGDEVPANSSKARGNAVFKVSDDGSQIDYRLIVANIDNAFMAHIHLGGVAINGPVVAFLFGPIATGGGTMNGVIGEGTITAASLVGPLTGHPLSDLLSAMQAGNAYVNVHTNDGVAPINTGPGDFPAGEIRSQIRPKD